MEGFYGRWADLNNDGEIDDYEKIIELEETERMGKFISGGNWDEDKDDDDFGSEDYDFEDW